METSFPLSLPVLETQVSIVSCMGGDSLFGHPLIYLNLLPEKQIICPYCSQKFVLVSEKKKRAGRKKLPPSSH